MTSFIERLATPDPGEESTPIPGQKLLLRLHDSSSHYIDPLIAFNPSEITQPVNNFAQKASFLINSVGSALKDLFINPTPGEMETGADKKDSLHHAGRPKSPEMLEHPTSTLERGLPVSDPSSMTMMGAPKEQEHFFEAFSSCDEDPVGDQMVFFVEYKILEIAKDTRFNLRMMASTPHSSRLLSLFEVDERGLVDSLSWNLPLAYPLRPHDLVGLGIRPRSAPNAPLAFVTLNSTPIAVGACPNLPPGAVSLHSGVRTRSTCALELVRNNASEMGPGEWSVLVQKLNYCCEAHFVDFSEPASSPSVEVFSRVVNSGCALLSDLLDVIRERQQSPFLEFTAHVGSNLLKAKEAILGLMSANLSPDSHHMGMLFDSNDRLTSMTEKFRISFPSPKSRKSSAVEDPPFSGQSLVPPKVKGLQTPVWQDVVATLQSDVCPVGEKRQALLSVQRMTDVPKIARQVLEAGVLNPLLAIILTTADEIGEDFGLDMESLETKVLPPSAPTAPLNILASRVIALLAQQRIGTDPSGKPTLHPAILEAKCHVAQCFEGLATFAHRTALWDDLHLASSSLRALCCVAGQRDLLNTPFIKHACAGILSVVKPLFTFGDGERCPKPAPIISSQCLTNSAVALTRLAEGGLGSKASCATAGLKAATEHVKLSEPDLRRLEQKLRHVKLLQQPAVVEVAVALLHRETSKPLADFSSFNSSFPILFSLRLLFRLTTPDFLYNFPFGMEDVFKLPSSWSGGKIPTFLPLYLSRALPYPFECVRHSEAEEESCQEETGSVRAWVEMCRLLLHSADFVESLRLVSNSSSSKLAEWVIGILAHVAMAMSSLCAPEQDPMSHAEARAFLAAGCVDAALQALKSWINSLSLPNNEAISPYRQLLEWGNKSFPVTAKGDSVPYPAFLSDRLIKELLLSSPIVNFGRMLAALISIDDHCRSLVFGHEDVPKLLNTISGLVLLRLNGHRSDKFLFFDRPLGGLLRSKSDEPRGPSLASAPPSDECSTPSETPSPCRRVSNLTVSALQRSTNTLQKLCSRHERMVQVLQSLLLISYGLGSSPRYRVHAESSSNAMILLHLVSNAFPTNGELLPLWTATLASLTELQPSDPEVKTMLLGFVPQLLRVAAYQSSVSVIGSLAALQALANMSSWRCASCVSTPAPAIGRRRSASITTTPDTIFPVEVEDSSVGCARCATASSGSSGEFSHLITRFLWWLPKWPSIQPRRRRSSHCVHSSLVSACVLCALRGLRFCAQSAPMAYQLGLRALKSIVNLATVADSLLDFRLNASVETLLIALGFQDGLSAVNLVRHDSSLLTDWFVMQRCLSELDAHLNKIFLHKKSLWLPQEEDSKSVALFETVSMLHCEEIEEDEDEPALPAKPSSRNPLVTFVQSLMQCAGSPHVKKRSSSTSRSPIAAAPTAIPMLRRFDPEVLRILSGAPCNVSLTTIERCCPSPLLCRLLYSPYKFQSVLPNELDLVSILPLPRDRQYFAFRYKSIIQQLMRRQRSAGWILAFQQIDPHGAFGQQLCDAAGELPSVVGISFSRSRITDNTVQMFTQLPPWVRFVVLHQSVTPHVLALLGHVLEAVAGQGIPLRIPSPHPSSNPPGAGGGPGLGLEGLAVRVTGGQWSVPNLKPLLRLLRIPVSSTWQGLKFLDLSGNRWMGDSGAAKVLLAVTNNAVLRFLDVSDCGLKKAREVVPSLVDSSVGLLTVNHTLHGLRLADNYLSAEALTAIMCGLENQSRLRTVGPLRAKRFAFNEESGLASIIEKLLADPEVGPLLDCLPITETVLGSSIDIGRNKKRWRRYLDNLRTRAMAVWENPMEVPEGISWIDLSGHSLVRVPFALAKLLLHSDLLTNLCISRCQFGHHCVEFSTGGMAQCWSFADVLLAVLLCNPRLCFLDTSESTLPPLWQVCLGGAVQTIRQARSDCASTEDFDSDSPAISTPQRRHSDPFAVSSPGRFPSLSVSTESEAPVPFEYPQASPRNLAVNTIEMLYSNPLVYRDEATRELMELQTLSLSQERTILCAALQQAKRDVKLRFSTATTANFHDILARGCQVLHYSGHGSDKFLSFEDGTGGWYFMSIDKLSRSLAAAKSHSGLCRVRVVVICTCESENAAKVFVEAGVPHVIAVRVASKLLDAAALVFVRSFYTSLFLGGSVAQAFAMAVQAVNASPAVGEKSTEHRKFVLLPENEALHTERVFLSLPPLKASTLQEASTTLDDRSVNLPSLSEDFVGRKIAVYNVVRRLFKHRLVGIVGTHGIGSTTVAISSTRYSCKRGLGDDGVIVARLKSVQTVDEFVALLSKLVFQWESLVTAEPVQLPGGNMPPDAEESLDLICSKLKSKRILLLLDHCENLQGSEQGPFLGVLQRLLHSSPGLVVLFTSASPIVGVEGIPARIIRLQPLSMEQGALLYRRLMGVQGEHGMGKSFSQRVMADALHTQSLEVSRKAGGHPGTIVAIAAKERAQFAAAQRDTDPDPATPPSGRLSLEDRPNGFEEEDFGRRGDTDSVASVDVSTAAPPVITPSPPPPLDNRFMSMRAESMELSLEDFVAQSQSSFFRKPIVKATTSARSTGSLDAITPRGGRSGSCQNLQSLPDSSSPSMESLVVGEDGRLLILSPPRQLRPSMSAPSLKKLEDR